MRRDAAKANSNASKPRQIRPNRFGARSTQGCDAPDRKDPPTARRELRATPFDPYGYVRGLPQNGFTVKCTFTALTEKRPTEASCAELSKQLASMGLFILEL